MIWVVACAAAMACAGCTFGDEPVQKAEPVVGQWFDQNCVPVECLFQCCLGWNYDNDPTLRGGNVPGSACEEVRQRNAAYSEYVTMMLEPQNWCTEDLAKFESGYCYEIEPPDAIRGYNLDGQPVYSGLSFLVCPPRGQHMAYPMEDVDLIRQE
jgi:hypothetical protein